MIINLGQNDYGHPAHTDPKTGKPVKNHLPGTEMWTSHYTSFVGVSPKTKTPCADVLMCWRCADALVIFW